MDNQLSHIHIGVVSMFFFALQALLVIPAMKWLIDGLAQRWKVFNGLSTLSNAV